MTDFHLEPDLEALVIDYLFVRSQADPPNFLPSDNISGKLHRALGPQDVAIRVRRIGGTPTENVTGHLVRARLQIDAFAPSESDAYAFAAIALRELRKLPSSDYVSADAVVTAVEVTAGITASPDPDSDLSRYRFDALVYGHAKPAAA